VGVPVLNVAVIGKHTILSTNNTGYQVTLLIGIGHALLVDNSLCRCREVVPHVIYACFDGSYFVHRYRGACIAFNTALTLANAQVATKLLRQYLRREQHITYLYNWG
jgi:hypothetical protein